MSSPVALIALLLWPASWGHHEVHVERRHVGQWRLQVQTEQFTKRVTCRLSERNVEYRRQALVFHLPANTDTSDAVYKVDGGQPIWSRSDAMDLAHLGFALHDDNLVNPSGGLVRVPEQRVAGGRVIAIQPRVTDVPIVFKIGGLSDVLELARKAGCDADAFY